MGKTEKINLIIGSLANLGVIASFLFTIWLHHEDKTTRLNVSCRAVLGEPCEIDRFMDFEHTVDYYVACSAVNNSSHSISIGDVNVFSQGAIGNVPPGASGSTSKGTLEDFTKRLNIVDSKGTITAVPLPRIIHPNDSLNFITHGSISIGNDLIYSMSSECNNLMRNNIVPYDFFRDCLDRDIFNTPFEDRRLKLDNLYVPYNHPKTNVTSIRVVLTDGTDIVEKVILSVVPKE